MPTLITSADKEKIKRAVPKASNKIVEAAVARLYISYPDPNSWTFTGITGAVVLANDLTGNTFFFKMVDIIGNRGVIWDQELYIDFQYNQDRAFFHTFELEECYAGLLFADDSEAHTFLKKVQHKEKHATKATLANKNAIAAKKNPTIAAQGPRGDMLRYQKLGNNYTLASLGPEPEADRKSVRSAESEDGDVPLKALVGKLEELGITEDMLMSKSPEAIKEMIAKNSESSSSSRFDKKSKGLPPPPPSQPPSKSKSAASTPSPPPPAETAPAASSTMFKVPPAFVPPGGSAAAPVGPASAAPLPSAPGGVPPPPPPPPPLQTNRLPSMRPSPSPSPGPVGSPYSASPSPPPLVIPSFAQPPAPPAPTPRVPPNGQKYNIPPPLPGMGSLVHQTRLPTASNPGGPNGSAPQSPAVGSPYGQQPQSGYPFATASQFAQPGAAGRPPPPLPSREPYPVQGAPPGNLANRPVPAPPSLPPRMPMSTAPGQPPYGGYQPVQVPASAFASLSPPMTSSSGVTPPPPPPHKHGSRTVQSTTPSPYNATPSPTPPPPPPPPASRMQATPRPQPPTSSNYSPQQAPVPYSVPTSYTAPASSAYNPAPVAASAGPPPPPPPYSYTSEPVQASAGPPPAPPAPSNYGASAPPAPPPPPGMSFSAGPPVPPPPPMAAGGDGDSRGALMDAIRHSGGIGGLKKVDKTQLEKPLIIPGAASNGRSNGGGAGGAGGGDDGNLQNAIAAALSKRKQKVAGNGDDYRDEW
ncbi:uncharacterized protein V1518DRAFT_412777 [Limtongia smithiae]|uniref:uncharacterized protein n=1 Tax=Limtongia smithiae TaxID=1125753 RepID=UPI0034CF17DC